jgi:predicted kinase
MRRLPQDRMMDVMLDRGQVTRGHVDALIEVLIPFFHTAERGPHIDPYGSVEAIRFNTDENFAETREYVGEALTAERYGDIMAYTNTFLRNTEAFETRVREGRIRDCHGDLHSANICLADQVVVYDCIEFNHRFRYSDVAADVAFLAMDLDFRGRADLANYFVREFSRRSGDSGLLAMLPFYKCYRAFVRGKISAFAYGQPEQRQEDRMKNLRLAKRYFALAHRYTGAYHRPHVAVIFGLSGTGKSTLAAKLGRELGWPVINSDRVRKELAGIAPTERPTEETARTLYSWEMTRKTYAAMMERAEELLADGQSVLLDATFLGREMRDMVGDMARRLDAEVHFILCECPEDIIRDRLNLRAADPETVSDADWRIYLRQKETFDPAGLETLSDFIPVDTSGSLDWVAHELAERLV